PEPATAAADLAPEANAPAPDLKPDTIVTFGAGTNPLSTLKHCSAGPPEYVWLAIVCILFAGWASAWLQIDLIKGPTTLREVLAVAILTPCSILLCLRGLKHTVVLAILLAVAYVFVPMIVVGPMFVPGPLRLPVFVLLIAMCILMSLIRRILSED